VEHLDARSDIYSLGRCCDSCSPASPKRLQFKWPSPRKIVGRHLRKVGLRVSRGSLPQRSEMALDVSRYLTAWQSAPHRESILEKAGRFYRRYSVAILLIAAYLFMRIVLLVSPVGDR